MTSDGQTFPPVRCCRDSYPVEPPAILARRRYAIALTSVRDFLTLALARLRVLGIAHRIPRASWGRRAGMFGFHL
jgi:hypothetical protein